MKRSCQRQTQVFDFAGPAHDLIGAKTVRAQQDDLSRPDLLVWGVAIRREHLQTPPIRGLRVMEIPVRMRQTRMRPARWESPPGFKMSGAIH